MKKLFGLALCLGCISVCSGSTTVPVAGDDFDDTVFSGQDLMKFEKNWKFRQGDDLAYAQPDFDDSQWRSIRISTPLAREN